jgi:hypothetical protein
MDAMKSMRDQRKKELERAMEEGRKKHLKMLRDVVQELTGDSLSLSDAELSDPRHGLPLEAPLLGNEMLRYPRPS